MTAASVNGQFQGCSDTQSAPGRSAIPQSALGGNDLDGPGQLRVEPWRRILGRPAALAEADRTGHEIAPITGHKSLAMFRADGRGTNHETLARSATGRPECFPNRFPNDRKTAGKTSKLPLAELEAPPRLRLAVFLPLNRAAVAGQEAGDLQDAAQLRLIVRQRAADTMAHRARLTGQPAAIDGADHVELVIAVRDQERLRDRTSVV